MQDVNTVSATPTYNEEIKPFEFTGKGFEYFKIWIVNILLTILTLGIYSAWATVRNKQYFYNNLFLDGQHFDYLAKPLDILKGRLIAVAALALYYWASVSFPFVALGLALALFFAIPYFYNQSLSFNARVSAYKNIQFRFKSSYGEAFLVLYVWPILGLLTLGILIPFSMLKMHQYIVKNSAYGTQAFDYDAKHFDYGKIFLIILGISLTVGGLSWGLMLMVPALSILSTLIFVGLYFFIFIYFMVSMNNLFYCSTSIKEHRLHSQMEISGTIKVVLLNTLFTILTLGLYLPAAKVRMTKYIAECTQLNAKGSLDNFIAAERESVSALGEQMASVFDFGN